MLQEMHRMAKDASLTGSLKEGARASAQQYNVTLNHLEKLDAVPDGLFPRLSEGATFDEVGVAAAQLAGYLESYETEAHPEPRVSGSHNVVIGLGNLREMKELKELGQYIRNHMPEWLKEKMGRPSEEKGPTNLSEIESRLAEVGAKLQAVAEQLRRGDLSDVQRADLAEELSKLGQEQARLAREHAMLREEQEKANAA